MIIAGAGGHAREILGVLAERGDPGEVFFYDDLSEKPVARIWDRFRVLTAPEQASAVFQKDPAFVIGAGNPFVRKSLFERLTAAGGQCKSVISPYARIGHYGVELGEGLNIMTGAVITQDIRIGEGTLIHINATIHHDCVVGNFCEISPGAHLLGKVMIEDLVSIGAGAVILPGIRIATRAVVGSGSVVTRNVEQGAIVKGVPARR